MRYPSSGTTTPASPWMGSHMKAQTLGSARVSDREGTSLKGMLLNLMQIVNSYSFEV